MKLRLLIVLSIISLAGCDQQQPVIETTTTVRIASFNIALASGEPDGVVNELKSNSKRIRNIAEIIRLVDADVLFIQELQFDEEGAHMALFRENYLETEEEIIYPYYYHFPTNAGHLTGYDLNMDGDKTGPYDAHGWGTFPNQFAVAIFSKHPIDFEGMRTFKNLKWKDLPGAHRPFDPGTNDYYWDEEAWESIFISSKNHVDVPIVMDDDTLHIIGMHAQGAAGDGAELRNTMKNYDEIKFLADYISGVSFQDDQGRSKAFGTTNSFVIVGDFNSNPTFRSSINDLAIEQLLNHPFVHAGAARGKWVPQSTGGEEWGIENEREEKASMFTARGIRIDYALPSHDLSVTGSGVFWPSSEQANHNLVLAADSSSDHMLVYIDIQFSNKNP